MNIMDIFSAIGSAFDLFSAVEARKESKRAARAAQKRAEQEADRQKADLERLRSKQRVAYARSGVKLSGTPTLVIDDTQAQGQKHIDWTISRNTERVHALNAKVKQDGIRIQKGRVNLISKLF